MEISLPVFQTWRRVIPPSLLPNVIPCWTASVFTRGNFAVKWAIPSLITPLPRLQESNPLASQISLGQYAGVGPVKVFRHIAPAFRGLGVAMVIVSLFLSFYYNVVGSLALNILHRYEFSLQVSWAIWYLVTSLSSSLDWARCGHDYNTEHCWSQVWTHDTVISL